MTTAFAGAGWGVSAAAVTADRAVNATRSAMCVPPDWYGVGDGQVGGGEGAEPKPGVAGRWLAAAEQEPRARVPPIRLEH